MIVRLASLSLVLLFACTSGAGPSAPPPADPSAMFRALQRASTTGGIDARGTVPIGGIDQWISVRGRHADSPLLLMLHGGPGFTSIPTSYLFMQAWEEYFVVAQWDQRGAGKTLAANPRAPATPAMTIDQMVSDAEAVVGYLRQRYHRSKIVLVGHSWGTVLGLQLAQRHPDWFYAYVGIGQLVSAGENEARGYQRTLAAARAAGVQPAVAELEAMAPFPDPARPARDLQNLERERHWLSHFGGSVWHGTEEVYDDLGKLSPDYTHQDRIARNQGLDLSLQAFWTPLSAIDFSRVTHLDCPVVFLHGRHDLVTNASLLAEWFERLAAPSKQVVWFEDSAHQVYEEEPAKTLITLHDLVLPLTQPR